MPAARVVSHRSVLGVLRFVGARDFRVWEPTGGLRSVPRSLGSPRLPTPPLLDLRSRFLLVATRAHGGDCLAAARRAVVAGLRQENALALRPSSGRLPDKCRSVPRRSVPAPSSRAVHLALAKCSASAPGSMAQPASSASSAAANARHWRPRCPPPRQGMAGTQNRQPRVATIAPSRPLVTTRSCVGRRLRRWGAAGLCGGGCPIRPVPRSNARPQIPPLQQKDRQIDH